jgi:hypothetical protein
MRHRFRALVLIASFLYAGCELFASDWPQRRGRTTEQVLLDLIQFHQQRYVKRSTGVLAHECFTDRDFASFKAAEKPMRIVERLRQAPDFAVVARMLRALPVADREATMRRARQTARPTWQEMGFIDRQGRGQTEAGHEAELMIARAIVEAFAADFDNR